MLETAVLTEPKVTYPKPSALLPHRAPILMVDEILDYEAGNFLIARKFIAEDNPFFQGHFPGYPILPGVILVEMMFQACGLYGRLEAMQNVTGAAVLPKSGRAIKIDNVSFHREVKPCSELEVRVEFKHKMLQFSTYKAVVTLNHQTAAKGMVTVSLV